MQIQIDGMRSSDDAWLKAQRAPLDELPELSEDDLGWARSMGASDIAYARSLYASLLTKPELSRKAEKVAALAVNWLEANGIDCEIEAVRLRTSSGIFDLYVNQAGEGSRIEVREDVVDDLLQGGSKTAADAIDRLLAANFGRLPMSKAS